jgi:peptide/nickel transport system permease protein
MLGQRLAFILRRVLQAIPILLAIVVINFLLLQLAPGDAVDVLAGEAGSATPEYMAELRAKFGLDQPIPVQLANYVAKVAVGRFRLVIPP